MSTSIQSNSTGTLIISEEDQKNLQPNTPSAMVPGDFIVYYRWATHDSDGNPLNAAQQNKIQKRVCGVFKSLNYINDQAVMKVQGYKAAHKEWEVKIDSSMRFYTSKPNRVPRQTPAVGGSLKFPSIEEQVSMMEWRAAQLKQTGYREIASPEDECHVGQNIVYLRVAKQDLFNSHLSEVKSAFSGLPSPFKVKTVEATIVSIDENGVLTVRASTFPKPYKINLCNLDDQVFMLFVKVKSVTFTDLDRNDEVKTPPFEYDPLPSIPNTPLPEMIFPPSTIPPYSLTPAKQRISRTFPAPPKLERQASRFN